MRQRKVVIYTAIFGNRDTLQEPARLPIECDFICFSDTKFSSRAWEVRQIKPSIQNDPVRSARKFKILPHRYLPEYSVSIWVDGNIIVRGRVEELIETYLGTTNLAVYNCINLSGNNAHSTIYEETEILLTPKMRKKADPMMVKNQLATYEKAGYGGEGGLAVTSVLLRRHNKKDVVVTMEEWWEHIKTYTTRDQMSFNYVAWKHNLSFSYIPGNCWDNQYFYRSNHRVSFCRKVANRIWYVSKKFI